MGFPVKQFLLFLIVITSLRATENGSVPVQIHGFVSQGFQISRGNSFLVDNSEKGSFEYRNVGVNFQKELGRRVRVGIQLISRDVGPFGNNKVMLDWAYGSYTIHNALTLSVGRIKNSLGFYSDVQDIDFLTPWASLPYYVYDKGLRTVTSSTDGAKISGNISLGRVGDLSYSYSIGTTDIGDNSDIEEYGNTINENFSDTEVDLVHVPQITYNSPIMGLSLNFAMYNAKGFWFKGIERNVGGLIATMDYEQDLNWYYAGIRYEGITFDLVAEYHHQEMAGTAFIHPFYHPLIGDTLYNETMADSTRRVGGYVGFNIKPIELVHVGGYLQLHWRDLYAGEGYDDPSHVSHDGALTLAFILHPSFVIKAEGHMVYGTALLSQEIHPPGVPVEDWWQYGILKLSYNF